MNSPLLIIEKKFTVKLIEMLLIRVQKSTAGVHLMKIF